MLKKGLTERRSVLLVALSGIGNFVMQSPVFEAIKTSHPAWKLTVWVAPRGTKALAESNPFIDEILEAPLKHSLWGHLTLVRYLRQKKFDTGIVLSPGQLWKSAAYLYLAGISQRIGHTYPFFANAQSSFLLTDALPEKEDLHDIEQNMRLLEVIGISYQSPVIPPTGGTPPSAVASYQLPVPEDYAQHARTILHGYSIPGGRIIVGFHVGSAAGFEWKRWPIENFAQVGRTLTHEHAFHILIFGGKDEAVLKQQLKAQLGADATLVDSDLLTCAALIKYCRLFLSNDSGLMHIAAAVGVPTYGLFGPTDEKKTGPRGPKSFIIRALGTTPVYDTEKYYSLGCTSHPSMLAITPELVIDRIRRDL